MPSLCAPQKSSHSAIHHQVLCQMFSGVLSTLLVVSFDRDFTGMSSRGRMLNKPRLTSLCYIFLLVFSFTSSYVKAASDGLSAYLCDHPALNEHPGIRDLSLLKSKLEVYRENGYLALATSTHPQT